jgi:hypothetical protein
MFVYENKDGFINRSVKQLEETGWTDCNGEWD